MFKFNPHTHELEARVQFTRGRVQKAKGEKLTREEADTMTDEVILQEITFKRLELVARPAASGDGVIQYTPPVSEAERLAAEAADTLTTSEGDLVNGDPGDAAVDAVDDAPGDEADAPPGDAAVDDSEEAAKKPAASRRAKAN